MKPQILVLDTLDDRRSVYELLGKLPPPHRIKFLVYCCGQVPQGQSRLPVPVVTEMQTTCDHAYRCDRADARLTAEVYCDVLQLFNTYSLDAAATAVELEKWIKRPEHRKARLHALLLSRRGPSVASSAAARARTGDTGT